MTVVDEDAPDLDLDDALSTFRVECESVLFDVQIQRNTNNKIDSVFMRAWEEFAKIHQSSPTRVNNNITSRSCQANNTRRRKGLLRGKHTLHVTEWRPGLMTSTVVIKLRIFLNLLELFAMMFTCLIIFYVIITNHKPTQALISRHTQDLIYPLMRGLRITTLPIIRLFPSLSNLYEEDCLITNPNYFKKSKYDCWPCEESRQVVDMAAISNFSAAVYHNGGIPFRIRQEPPFSEHGFSLIEKIYLEQSHLFSAVTLTSSISTIRTLADVFPLNTTKVFALYDDLHITWKINKVTHARYLRKYFVKPHVIPSTTEVSIERYLFLDNFHSPQYALPFTEFENVFLYQVGGCRRIVLIPSETCFNKCRVISIVLQYGDILFYNWLFWRPESLPVEFSGHQNPDDSSSSLAYVGSFY